MKNLNFLFGMILFGLSTVSAHARVGAPVKYPRVVESIRCLVVNPESSQVETKKSLIIEKVYSNPKDFEYTVTVGIHEETDYGTVVTLDDRGFFHYEDKVFKLGIQVTPHTVENFEKPQNLEPFYVQYEYDNSFFDQHDKLTAKCLHRIF